MITNTPAAGFRTEAQKCRLYAVTPVTFARAQR